MNLFNSTVDCGLIVIGGDRDVPLPDVCRRRLGRSDVVVKPSLSAVTTPRRLFVARIGDARVALAAAMYQTDCRDGDGAIVEAAHLNVKMIFLTST